MASRYPVQPPFPHGVNPKRQHPVQLQSQQQPSNEQAQKHREYLKQQQKLRLMASATHKSQPVSTDTLIENILGKKETFQQLTLDAQVPGMPSSNVAKTGSNIKAPQTQFQALKGITVEWLSPASPNFPPLYQQVWALVGLPDGMVDTSKIYPLLLTSGLHTDVLGFIWGLSNLRVPGVLAEQELYILLALVALAQRGYSFNCASVLNLVPQPPLPGLNLGAEPRLQFGQEVNRKPQPSPAHSASHADVLSTHFGNITPAEVQRSPLTSVSQCSSTPFTNEHRVVDKPLDVSVLPAVVSSNQSDFDDFTDFQSASQSSSSGSMLPDQASFPRFDASGDLETKDLQENTTIAVTKPSNNSIVNRSSSSLPQDSKTIPALKFPTVAIVGGGRSIGSRLANHSLTTPKAAKTRHHKHHHHHHRSVPPTVPQSSNDEEFSDFQQASAGEVFSKNSSVPPPMHTYVLKESAIRIDDSKNIPKIPEPSSTNLQLVNEKQTTHITEKVNSNAGIKPSKEDGVLMGVDEDRYSALRALSAFNDSPGEPEEEYGEFFCAKTAPNDSFADIAARDNPNITENVVPWGAMGAAEPQNSVFEVEEWSSFVSLGDATHLPNLPPMQENLNAAAQSHSNEKPHFQLTDEWGTESPTVDSLSANIADLNLSKFSNATSIQARKPTFAGTSGDETLEPKTFFPLSDLTSHPVPSISTVVSENKSDIDDFGDFVSPTPWSETEPNVDGGLVGNMWLDEGKETDNQSVGKLWLDEPKGNDSSSSWSDVGKYESVKSTKDGFLDNPLVSSLWLEEGKGVDNQSVRSLELPGLDQAWDCVGEWRRCVQACVSVLQFAVDTLDSISGPKVLLEVLTSCEGLDYLRALTEVWTVCERLASSYRQSGSDHKLDALLNSAESMWITLKPHLIQAQLTVESNEVTEGGEFCGICLVGGAKLEFGGHNYHAVCANLWLNMVDTGLPALHQP